MNLFDGQSRVFAKRYLVVLEILSIVVVVCMGYLFWASTTPAQGSCFFIDVVSGKLFSLAGKIMF
jgi:hypothetical protein